MLIYELNKDHMAFSFIDPAVIWPILLYDQSQYMANISLQQISLYWQYCLVL